MENETLLTIMQWGQDTFPLATLDGQMTKFKDEYFEFCETDGKDILELCDMFIVACNIARLDAVAGAESLSLVWQTRMELDILDKDFQKALNEKMAINRARKWERQGGKYQHVEK